VELQAGVAAVTQGHEPAGTVLGQSRSGLPIREVRHKSLQVAQKRVRTVLNWLTPKDEAGSMNSELAEALEKLGL
jgi:hypothetical protein